MHAQLSYHSLSMLGASHDTDYIDDSRDYATAVLQNIFPIIICIADTRVSLICKRSQNIFQKSPQIGSSKNHYAYDEQNACAGTIQSIQQYQVCMPVSVYACVCSRVREQMCGHWTNVRCKNKQFIRPYKLRCRALRARTPI